MRASLFARRVGFLMLSADKGGGSGSEKKTDLELLEEAREQVTKLNGDLQAANEKADKLEADVQAATDLASKAETEMLEAQKDLAASEKRKGELEVSLAELQRNKEQAGASGVTAIDKSEESQKSVSDSGAALWEKYAAASPTEKARLRSEHGSKLDAAAAAFDKARKA